MALIKINPQTPLAASSTGELASQLHDRLSVLDRLHAIPLTLDSGEPPNFSALKSSSSMSKQLGCWECSLFLPGTTSAWFCACSELARVFLAFEPMLETVNCCFEAGTRNIPPSTLPGTGREQLLKPSSRSKCILRISSILLRKDSHLNLVEQVHRGIFGTWAGDLGKEVGATGMGLGLGADTKYVPF